ncbi:IclR family transcriptional regulator [Streptomyces sp. BE133]|uniref:IclR family transcriptional regulator n=1 Tax=Streptomyces sp. BE133 TaxID=3002523 RepID=UPI002E76B792|nr:IclR family transcriptional regulator [Streptomyces sp. BE133]MEE1807673.1 IclR family transcriptional regulator [Streptomyces sp. BE133]
MQNQTPSYPIESVDRALQLIGMLQAGHRLSVKTAAEKLGVASSTAHRLFGALCYRGFARQDEQRLYRAGPALNQRTPVAVSYTALKKAVRPALEELQLQLGESANLMVLQGAYIRFLDGVESERMLRVGLRTDGTMPAYCSAGGKAILAALDPADVEEVHHDGLPRWPTAKISTVDELARHLTEVQHGGYGVSLEETEEGVAGVGACLRDWLDRPVGAITVAVPSTRFSQHDLRYYADPVREAAAAASRRIGEQCTA